MKISIMRGIRGVVMGLLIALASAVGTRGAWGVDLDQDLNPLSPTWQKPGDVVEIAPRVYSCLNPNEPNNIISIEFFKALAKQRSFPDNPIPIIVGHGLQTGPDDFSTGLIVSGKDCPENASFIIKKKFKSILTDVHQKTGWYIGLAPICGGGQKAISTIAPPGVSLVGATNAILTDLPDNTPSLGVLSKDGDGIHQWGIFNKDGKCGNALKAFEIFQKSLASDFQLSACTVVKMGDVTYRPETLQAVGRKGGQPFHFQAKSFAPCDVLVELAGHDLNDACDGALANAASGAMKATGADKAAAYVAQKDQESWEKAPWLRSMCAMPGFLVEACISKPIRDCYAKMKGTGCKCRGPLKTTCPASKDRRNSCPSVYYGT